ncbi:MULTISPECIES: peptidase M3 [Myxococcaceae]|uniref:peptidase M3 n=1 Tax=Myxococcaceae TaxID=31 RepID=UPI00188ECB32|nr:MULTISPECIES: peptidase M3 [Myxococcaceae]MBF5043688.1 peptidase M3 [Simulacricoccus sp. 17bor-14]
MDRPLHSLHARLDDFLTELATLHYRHGAGLSPTLPLADLYRSFPELSSQEAFAELGEGIARASARGEGVTVRRLSLLRERVAAEVEEALGARAAERVAAHEAQSQLAVDDRALSLSEALSQLPREPHRGRRGLLERAAGSFLWEARGLYGDRREAALRAAERLGFPDYLALQEAVTGIALAPLLEQAEATLKATEDAYRDLLGYVLKKVDPLLRPLPAGGAHRHDLQYALRAPWMAEHFRREDLGPALRHFLMDMGFDTPQQRYIRLDDEAREGKSPRPFVVALQVPRDVRLVVQPHGGLDALGALLHEYGHAQHLAHVDDGLPVELRRLSDPSVTEGVAALFDRLPADAGWLKRYLRLPTSPATDGARLAAFGALAVLRRHCAKLAYERSLSLRGPSEERAEEYAEGQRRALAVEPHAGFFLFDVDPQLYGARYLRGWALEARLQRHLTQRFNEDFWRNPAAGAWLRTLFARGGALDAEALAQELSAEPLSLPEAGARLVAVLNA